MTKLDPLRQSSSVAFDNSDVAAKAADSESAQEADCLKVYQRHVDYLISSARRLGVPTRDVEDVLHEVFLVIMKRWDDFDPTRPLKPWLFGITFRVASSHRRRHLREVPDPVADDSCETEDLAVRPDDAVAARQDRALLLRALAAIPMDRRAVLVMHEVDEIGMRDIAHHLSIPLFTAYSRLRKARKELDAALVRLHAGGARAR